MSNPTTYIIQHTVTRSATVSAPDGTPFQLDAAGRHVTTDVYLAALIASLGSRWWTVEPEPPALADVPARPAPVAEEPESQPVVSRERSVDDGMRPSQGLTPDELADVVRRTLPHGKDRVKFASLLVGEADIAAEIVAGLSVDARAKFLRTAAPDLIKSVEEADARVRALDEKVSTLQEALRGARADADDAKAALAAATVKPAAPAGKGGK